MNNSMPKLRALQISEMKTESDIENRNFLRIAGDELQSFFNEGVPSDER
jgi:hypothetical protein